MLTSCPRIIDLTPSKALGVPQNHDRVELRQPLVLSKEKPIVFNSNSEQLVKKDSLTSQPTLSELANALKDERMFKPIKTLSIQSGEDWIIKARITKKGKVVSYQNGCLFKIELIDEDGTQIEGTFYKDSVEKFFDKIEEGKVYVITKGQIATANKRFTSIQNDFRVIFTEYSVIQEFVHGSGGGGSQSDESMKSMRQKFNFVTIEEIVVHINELRQLDVCGIVCSSPQYDGIQVNFDHGKGPVKGRLIFNIMDRSSDIITVYIWGELAVTQITDGDLIVMNGARVSNFGGKSLNCGQDHCKLLVNPPLEQVNENISQFVDLARCKSEVYSAF